MEPTTAATNPPATPDPGSPDWERAQTKYRNCTQEQIDQLYRLRPSIAIAFASDLGLTRKPKK